MSSTKHEHTWTINNDGDWAHCDCGKSGYPVFIAADNERRAEQVYDELRQREQRFASALRVIKRKALEQVNAKSPEWVVTDTLKRIAITVDYAVGINTTKEQPMSDTLQEREDEMAIADYSGTEWCPQCGHKMLIEDNEPPVCSCCDKQDQAATDYCNECKGRPHAPWCSEYKEADEHCPFTRTWVPDPCVLPKGHTGRHMNAIEQEIATTEHQPAARGGGDEWYVASRSTGEGTIRRKTVGLHDWVGQVKLEYLDQIVAEHNQHHSLVAELDALRGEALGLVAERERLTLAATRTARRLDDLPRFLRENGFRVLGDVVGECLTELREATEQRSTSE